MVRLQALPEVFVRREDADLVDLSGESCCRGQRMGIFSGSGVGKSVLLSMLARNVAADISVIGLVGELDASVYLRCDQLVAASREQEIENAQPSLARGGAEP